MFNNRTTIMFQDDIFSDAMRSNVKYPVSFRAKYGIIFVKPWTREVVGNMTETRFMLKLIIASYGSDD